jgi:hypothetical protein
LFCPITQPRDLAASSEKSHRIFVFILFIKRFSCDTESELFGNKPDAWIVRTLDGMIKGVVEVKRPGKKEKSFEDPLIYGQVFDYLLRARSFYNLSNVFAILSNYKEWQVLWLKDSDHSAQATTLQASSVLGNLQYDITSDRYTDCDVPAYLPRECYASKIYGWIW